MGLDEIDFAEKVHGGFACFKDLSLYYTAYLYCGMVLESSLASLGLYSGLSVIGIAV